MASSLQPFPLSNSGFVEKPASDWRAQPTAEPETVLRSPRPESPESVAPQTPTQLPTEFPSVWRRLFLPASEFPGIAPGADPAEGTSLGHFTIQRRIGAGAMGSVFLAYDDRLHRNVALKILSPMQAMDPSTVLRFQNEAQAAARLDHDHVARVFYYGEENGLHFIAYEYIAGINLRDLLRQRGKLTPAEVVNYAIQITTAVRHTARNGVVHRDIKPSNIIVMPHGRAKLVDLGLAKRDGNESGCDLTVAGTTLGTFDYISPEQARDPRSVDVRSDLYSLGCTLYHLLTGEPPYPVGTVLQKLLDHQAQDTPDVSRKNRQVPPALSAIVRKMMASDPRRRYSTPDELLRDLAVVARNLNLRVVTSESATLVPESRLRGTWWDRHLGWMITSAALLLCVVALQVLPNVVEQFARWTQTSADSRAPIHRKQTVTTTTPELPGNSRDPEAVSVEDSLANSVPSTTEDESAIHTEVTTTKEPASTPQTDVETSESPLDDVPLVTKSETGKPTKPNPETGLSANSLTTVPMVELPGPTITIVGSLTKTGFASLEEACQEAKNGDIIELRGSGTRILSEHALRLFDKHLTIRAAKGSTKRPLLEFSETLRTGDSSMTRLITVAGGSLQMMNIDILAKVNPSFAGNGWTLFALERPEQLKLDGVTITVQNPLSRPSTILELGSSTGSNSGKARLGPQSLPPEILVTGSVIRGSATLLSVREAVSARLAIEDSLVTLNDSLLQVGARPSMTNGESSQINFELSHSTVLLSGSLVIARAENTLNDHPMPIVVSAQNNLISVGQDRPLIELAGSNLMELRDTFIWSGKRNGYDNIHPFWESQKNVSLDFSAWKSQWGGEITGSTNGPIRWKTAVRMLAMHAMTPADVALETGGNPNPAIDAADDGTDLGAPLQRLPTPPDVSSVRAP